MLSLTEKVIVLKAVSIFAETSDDILTEVIGLLEEIDYGAGATVFEKGDLGTCMYIIVDGKVRVHDGPLTLNFLSKLDVFGEMSALDPEPRSATVTAVENTRVFRLDREPLFDLMSSRQEVGRGIVHVLCQRLRARVRDLADDYEYLQQFARVTAAASAVEAGIYQPESIDEVARRTDALGQLARVFQRMAREVHGREQRLKQEVEQLRIEIDEARKTTQVAELTETAYFKELQSRARAVRRTRTQLPKPREVESQPDFEGAKRFVLGMLEEQLSPSLRYHSIGHTRDDVLPAVERLAALEGVEGEDLLLLRTAALFHDVGFIEQRQDHEGVGVRIAASSLPRFGYSPRQIEIIACIVQATRLPQSPRNQVEQIMADADLDMFGRDDFFAKNGDLRTELQEQGALTTDEEWYRGQLEFLQSHSYFTASARTLRDEGKRRNVHELAKLLAESER